MNNSSSTELLLPPPPASSIVTYWIQLSFSLPAVLINFPVTATMFATKSLRTRREMVPCAVASLLELLNALSYVMSSASQLSNRFGPRPGMTPWECMQMFYNSLMGFASQASAWSMVLLSVDRFICVLSINFYLSLGKRYVIMLHVVPLIAGTSNLATAWVGSSLLSKIPSIHPGSCFYPSAVSAKVIYISSWFGAIPGYFGSVAVYGAALLVLRFAHFSNFESVAKTERQRQKKATLVIGLITLVTFLTQAIPSLFNVAMAQWFPELQLSLSTYVAAVKMTNALFYSLVLWTRSNPATEILLKTIRRKIEAEGSESAAGFVVVAAGSSVVEQRGQLNDKF